MVQLYILQRRPRVVQWVCHAYFFKIITTCDNFEETYMPLDFHTSQFFDEMTIARTRGPDVTPDEPLARSSPRKPHPHAPASLSARCPDGGFVCETHLHVRMPLMMGDGVMADGYRSQSVIAMISSAILRDVGVRVNPGDRRVST